MRDGVIKQGLCCRCRQTTDWTLERGFGWVCRECHDNPEYEPRYDPLVVIACTLLAIVVIDLLFTVLIWFLDNTLTYHPTLVSYFVAQWRHVATLRLW